MNKLFFSIYIFFVICVFVPSTGYAYLDPGTGNAVIYVVLSLLGAVFYFLKGLFYKFVKKSDLSSNQTDGVYDSIVIFGERKAYWKVFKPIVEKLIEEKQFFSYYTMDKEDPCLQIDNMYIKNRYIGNGNRAYVKIGNLKANVVLSTTPNIGTEGYPIPRSKKIRKLVHVFHAFVDMTYYHKGSLDHYDAVMLVGAFEVQPIRQLEKMRGLPEKELYPAGLPYMDDLLKNKRISTRPVTFNTESDVTVLLAPSWGDKGFLGVYGTDFIERLAQKKYNLIIRPHPQSQIEEEEMLSKAKEKLSMYDNIAWDYNLDGTESFEKADILISDASSIRMDFSFVYERPFITIPIYKENLIDFEMDDLKYSYNEEAAATIGYTINKDEINNLDQIIMKILRERKYGLIREFWEKNIYNVGKSGEVIADYLIKTNNSILMEQRKV